MRATFAALVAQVLLMQQAPAPQQVFRAAVDLVVVDVAVVGKDGTVVADLTPADFTIVADKRPRRVVSAEYVAAPGRSTSARVAGEVAAPRPSSNAQSRIGRSFLFVVDVDQIAAGDGMTAMKSIASYLDKLGPDDLAGIVAFPTGTPRVDLTADHARVKAVASGIVGNSRANQGEPMTVGEAQAIESQDSRAILDYCRRIKREVDCDNLEVPPTTEDGEKQRQRELEAYFMAATRVMDGERRHSTQLFDTLRALSAAMAPLSGQKALVLVSNGVVNDPHTLDDLARFGAAAEQARVTLYALNLQGPIVDVTSRYNMTQAHILDHKVLLGGMMDAALAGRGDAFLVSGTPTAALERVDREMSGYYLLSFERDAQDKDGDRAGIDVRVNRPEVTVRARREFTLRPPAASPFSGAPIDLKGAIGELLRWPVPITTVEICADAYTMLLPGKDGRTILAATMAGTTDPLIAVGYEVSDAAGKVVADDAVIGMVETQSLADSRRLYAAAVELPEGRYQWKLATIDRAGRRGSVEHAFEVRIPRAGAIRLGDLFLGEISEGRFLPSPSLATGATALPVRADLLGDTAASFEGATLTVVLGRAGGADLAAVPIALRPSDDPRKRVGLATLAIGSLPPGDYTVTVRLSAGGATASVARLFVKR